MKGHDRETGAQSPENRLSSWKSIARYIGRSERTVRRWESAECLPVHRLIHASGQTVYAFTNEIDAWISRRSEHPVVQQGWVRLLVHKIDDLSEQRLRQQFCLGLTEELTSRFCQLANGALHVLEWNRSSEQPSSKVAPDYWLNGSVREHDAELKVTLHLVDAKSGDVIGTYVSSSRLDDPIAPEDRIAEAATRYFMASLAQIKSDD